MMIRVPRSRASVADASSAGGSPLLVIRTVAPSSIDWRWASARLPTTTMSPSEILLSLREASIEWTQTRPETIPSSPSISSPSSDVDDRRDGRRGVGEAVGLAGLADVAVGEGALGHHADQLPVGADDRDEVEVVGGHRPADLAQRLAVLGDREGSPA